MSSYQLRNLSPVRFDYLSGVGSGGCMDIDALMERHGNFIVIENKTPGESLYRRDGKPTGQLRGLRQLAALPQFQVKVVYGIPPNNIISYGDLDGPQESANVIEVRSEVQQWWDSH